MGCKGPNVKILRHILKAACALVMVALAVSRGSADTPASQVSTQTVQSTQTYPEVPANGEGWFDVGGFCKVVDVGDLSTLSPPASGIPVFVPGPVDQWENYRTSAPAGYGGHLTLTTCCRPQSGIATACATGANPQSVSRQYGKLGEVDQIPIQCKDVRGFPYEEDWSFTCSGDNGPDGQATWLETSQTQICQPNAYTTPCTAACPTTTGTISTYDSCDRVQSVNSCSISCCTPTPGSCSGACGGGAGVDSCGNACTNTQACDCAASSQAWTGYDGTRGVILVCGGDFPNAQKGTYYTLTSTPADTPNSAMVATYNTEKAVLTTVYGWGSSIDVCTASGWQVMDRYCQWGAVGTCEPSQAVQWTDPRNGYVCSGNISYPGGGNAPSGAQQTVSAYPPGGYFTGSAQYYCDPSQNQGYASGTQSLGWVPIPGTTATCVPTSGTCSPVGNGTTGPYPNCTITCNPGYTLAGGSCISNSPPLPPPSRQSCASGQIFSSCQLQNYNCSGDPNSPPTYDDCGISCPNPNMAWPTPPATQYNTWNQPGSATYDPTDPPSYAKCNNGALCPNGYHANYINTTLSGSVLYQYQCN